MKKGWKYFLIIFIIVLLFALILLIIFIPPKIFLHSESINWSEENSSLENLDPLDEDCLTSSKKVKAYLDSFENFSCSKDEDCLFLGSEMLIEECEYCVSKEIDLNLLEDLRNNFFELGCKESPTMKCAGGVSCGCVGNRCVLNLD